MSHRFHITAWTSPSCSKSLLSKGWYVDSRRLRHIDILSKFERYEKSLFALPTPVTELGKIEIGRFDKTGDNSHVTFKSFLKPMRRPNFFSAGITRAASNIMIPQGCRHCKPAITYFGQIWRQLACRL